MRLDQKEKYETILLVEGSELGVNGTLKELGIPKSTFYNWYNAYLEDGYDGLKYQTRKGNWLLKLLWNILINHPEKWLVTLPITTSAIYPNQVFTGY
jgi:hypothetical protein